MLFLRTPRYQPYNNPGQQNLANLVRLQWKLAYEQLHPTDEVRQAISRIVNPKGQNTHLARIRSLEESHILITDELRANFERWKEPRTFFIPESSCGSLEAISSNDNPVGTNLEESAIRIHHALEQIITGGGDVTSFRARILAVALYDMRALWLQDTSRLTLSANDKAKLERCFGETISWKRVYWYLKVGSRLREIADGNGGLGALLVIPGSLLKFTP